MIAIYKIINRRNGKSYVGQTRQPLEKRFLQHAKAHTPLGDAMRECGLENFTIEVIERCETQAQANERERFWIRVLNCKVPNGYNQRDGGASGGNCVKRPTHLTETKTVGERVKQLRQTLNLNQTKFGEKIGIGQQSVAGIESGTIALTPRNFDAICEKFNVNPDWLRDGVGEMFLPEKVETYLDKIVAEKNLSPEDRALIESILELPPEARKNVIDWAEKLIARIHRQETEQAKADERRVLEKQMADIQQRLAELDGASSWGEESSIKAGGTFWNSEKENSA